MNSLKLWVRIRDDACDQEHRFGEEGWRPADEGWHEHLMHGVIVDQGALEDLKRSISKPTRSGYLHRAAEQVINSAQPPIHDKVKPGNT